MAAEAESEMALERQRSGRRPSFVAKREEGMRKRSDQHIEEEGLLDSPSISIRRFSLGDTIGDEGDGMIFGQFLPVEEEVNVGTVTTGGVSGKGVSVEHKGGFQLGVASGLRQIVVPESRSAGCSSKCLINVTWKELKMLPSTVSQKW
jgi:hypothetical protein